MTAGEIKRLFIPRQTTHHPAAFKSAGNQGGQFRRSTSERTSPCRCPSWAIDCRRSSQELRAWRALARNFGLPSSQSVAVFNSGQPPGTSPVRRSRKFCTICLRRSTVFGICSVPSKRVSIAIFQAWSKASPASSCLLAKCR